MNALSLIITVHELSRAFQESMLVPGMHFPTHPFPARTHAYQLPGHPEICRIGVYHPLQENLLARLLSLSRHQMFTNSILLFWITNNFCTSAIPVTDKQLSSLNDDYSGTQTHCFLNYISSAFIPTFLSLKITLLLANEGHNFFRVLMNVKDPQVLMPSAVQATMEINLRIQIVKGK